ncbi:MAG: sugar ABC transporter substrate-binding protein [Ornithinimicrobium sp.]|uniref:sugar ABC transporter substrate-binding protein n=1 Tax=Ornithinimicrobium sp. TaxID=1977084 RepID=UPI0026E0AE23|nr:sugar ABC transporter substrate-binding protein [Ornithinimicrobium sp.]MDO5740138.1 sugar ABC transporter substrate-binding protein [Ornithinimicrobium sp.]
MRRTTMMIAFTASAALALSGCGRDSGDTGSSGDAPAQTGAAISTADASGDLDVWAMGAEGEKLPELVKEFTAAYPDILVNVTAVPWDSAHDKFVNSITAGTTPDVAMVGTTWMGEFAGMDALDPTPGSIDTSSFFPGAQGTTVVDGTSYGVPWYVETRMVYYRTDVATKAGMDKVPADQAGFKDMAAAMKEKGGADWGISLQPGGQGSWQTVLPFAWSAGASVASDSAYTFDTPEMVKAVDYYGSFFADKLANPSPPEGQTEADFVSGAVPMFISGPWMMAIVEDFAKGDGDADFAGKYDVAPIPAAEGGESSSFIGGSNLAVFKSTESRDAAWTLVEWLSQPETQVKWYGMTTDLPSVQSAWEDQSLTKDEKLTKFGEALKTAQAPPSFPSWEEVATSFDGEIEKVAKSGLSAEEALKAAQAKADSIGTGQ